MKGRKLIVIILVSLVFLAGCSKSKSVNEEAKVTYIGSDVEVGTTLSVETFLAALLKEDVADGTTLSVVDASSLYFDTVGTMSVDVRLTLNDDVINKRVTVNVIDTLAPVILGAYDREVAVNTNVDVLAMVSTLNSLDTLSVTPEKVDTSKVGKTTIKVTASDSEDTVTTSFDIYVSDFSEPSAFEHYGQTYNDQNALNIGTDLVLVNKTHGLGTTYVPDDLITIDDDYAFEGRQGIQLVEHAYDAFVALNEAMVRETGYSGLSISTAYRSASFQNTLYSNYVASEGVVAADTYSARPGFSEHQTGLALDIAAEGKNLEGFGDTQQAQWVAENAARFGFIIRFPEGKERITGYKYESWHLRYVGVEFAQKIVDSGLTFDEFIFAYGYSTYGFIEVE